jgi:hypothetical protein
MDPVAVTGLLVAAIRAEETLRDDRLFDDPFADALAGDAGRAALARYRAAARNGTVPIIEAIESLAVAGSVILYDVLGQSMLDSPMVAPTLEAMRELGAPWTFGTDEPAALVGPAWTATVAEPAVVGNGWKRWPFPAPPPGIPGIPRSYFVEATKA